MRIMGGVNLYLSPMILYMGGITCVVDDDSGGRLACFPIYECV